MIYNHIDDIYYRVLDIECSNYRLKSEEGGKKITRYSKVVMNFNWPPSNGSYYGEPMN